MSTEMLEIDQAAAAADALAHGGTVVVSRPDGAVALPNSAAGLVADLLDRIRRGERVRVVSDDEEITTQQAADLLNVSRPFVVGLIERDELPSRRVGSHRRLRLADVLLYRDIQRARQKAAADALANEAQELGIY